MPESLNSTHRAIENARRHFARARRGDSGIPRITKEQIDGQLSLAVDRVMAEGALYDRHAAALAIRQTCGDLVEAVLLVRAFRTTLKRFGSTRPLGLENMQILRRISGAFDRLTGGQILGPAYDHCLRLIDFGPDAPYTSLPPDITTDSPADRAGMPDPEAAPFRVLDMPDLEGLVEAGPEELIGRPVADLTRQSPAFPFTRDLQLQGLARGDEGFLLGCAHSLEKESGSHSRPYLGELRVGQVEIRYTPPELGFEISVGVIRVTECTTLTRNKTTGGSAGGPGFETGYGLVFGHNERKAVCMSLLDRSLKPLHSPDRQAGPAQDQAFVLSHCDNAAASGFVQEMKLPHYVDFQAELGRLRSLKNRALGERTEQLEPIL